MGISVSKRFIISACAGVPVILSCLWLPVPLVIFWVYNILLFGLLAVDYFITPDVRALLVERSGGFKLSHRVENEISFTVRNNSRFDLRVQALDAVNSRHFTVIDAKMKMLVPAGEEKIFSYKVIPSKRGAFNFPRIYLRFRGVLGLIIKYGADEQPAEFKVYPNLRDLGRFRLMTQKNRLLPQGDKAVRIFGTGTEFESLRAYVEGDDYRKMNWMVTARENRLMVNNYQIEKNQPIFMLIDAGRPMGYSVKGYKKLDYAINAALVLSDIVNQKGDRSGLLVFDTEVKSFIMPGKGEAHRNGLMEALYHIQDTRRTSDYEGAFRFLCDKQKQRSLVFIFTDFETLEEGRELTEHIAMLKRRHMPVVVFMRNEGLISLAEDKDASVREVAGEFLEERKRLALILNTMRIPNIETDSENFSAAAVNRYLRMRRS